MKKEITALVESKEGTLKLNQFCTLYRWTWSITEVDKLEVRFDLTSASSHMYEIHSRDWQGIVEEIKEAQTKAFADAAETLNKQIANGYIG